MKKSKLKSEIIGFSILLISSVFISYPFAGKKLFSSFNYFITNVSYSASFGFFYWRGNLVIGKLTGKYLNWQKNALNANTITLLIYLFYGIIISLTIPFIFHKYVFKVPSEHLIGHMLGPAFFGMTIDLAVLGVFYSKYLAKYWMETLKSEEKLKQENLMAKYEALKNQVNPHFLFNTLNTLTGIVEKDSKLATKYIKKLSDIYRYVLEQKDKDAVNISEELEFVEDYIYLQKMRYGKGLTFTINISSMDGYVAPLALQLLLENAIKHNIISDDEPLQIELIDDNDFYILKNNLQKKKAIQKNSQIGLDNLYKRYEILSIKKVEIIENQDEFIVKLPKLEIKSLVS